MGSGLHGIGEAVTANLVRVCEQNAKGSCGPREHAIVNLETLEADAAAHLEPSARSYIERGAGSGDTRAANLAAWRRLRLRPRVLRDVARVQTETTVLGVPVASPVLVAPTAMHRLACDEGERATARAAAEARTIMIVSMASSFPLEAVAAAAPDAPRFAQMYMLRDRGKARALAEHARACGCRAIVASVDGAAVPYGRAARADARIELPDDVARLVDDFDPSVTFDDLGRFHDWSGLPVVVKGVLRGDDAIRCVDAGASAIAVSNHGGRLVDGCLDTATALADVVDDVAATAEIYVDGGLRSGADVLRALALGARATLIGRPVLWGLAIGGEQGALDVLTSYTNDLRRAMAFCGATSLAEIDRDLVVPTHGDPRDTR
ncbi:MAG TPA: alpha-hydroxy acid oxidase [Acidimicrobiia bacterium]